MEINRREMIEVGGIAAVGAVVTSGAARAVSGAFNITGADPHLNDRALQALKCPPGRANIVKAFSRSAPTAPAGLGPSAAASPSRGLRFRDFRSRKAMSCRRCARGAAPAGEGRRQLS